jgi:hydrogenase maturation factor
MTVNIQWNWESTPYQSLTTKDGKAIICQIAYKYRLLDEPDKVRKHIVELNDETATRVLAFGAAVAAVVEVSTLQELREATEEGVNKAILELARKELNDWGYKLTKVEWVQRPEMRTLRLMQDVTSITEPAKED